MKITARQIKAVKNLSNITKYKTEKEALIKAGYSPSYAHTGIAKKSQGFQALLDKNLSTSKLLKKHNELLNKKEYIARNNNITGAVELIPTGQIDAQAVKSALDMAYKLKGAYAPVKHLNINLKLTDEQRKKAKDAIRTALENG